MTLSWVGIDVGGRRKGFHAAALHESLRVDLAEFGGAEAVRMTTDWVGTIGPACVAIDSPAAWAPRGSKARPCEVQFFHASVCGIRFTPSEEDAAVRTDDYYGWIAHGLMLWAALKAAGVRVIECFPTASWTQWHEPRRARSRAEWSDQALRSTARDRLRFSRPPSNQDLRDAVGAALTAVQAERQDMLTFGALTVPPRRSDPLSEER